MLAEKKLTPYQGLLHAIWTDERISGSCVSIKTTDQLREDADAARRYEPLKTAEIEQLRDAALAFGPTLCADCDGRCSVAAGTKAELGNLTRFLTYHEHHGIRAEARRQYAALSPEARDWSGADLEAARAACPNKLDFARLLPRWTGTWPETGIPSDRESRAGCEGTPAGPRARRSPSWPPDPSPRMVRRSSSPLGPSCSHSFCWWTSVSWLPISRPGAEDTGWWGPAWRKFILDVVQPGPMAAFSGWAGSHGGNGPPRTSAGHTEAKGQSRNYPRLDGLPALEMQHDGDWHCRFDLDLARGLSLDLVLVKRKTVAAPTCPA